MKKSLFVCVCVYVLTSVPAHAIPLGILAATDGTIEVGGKIFHDFGGTSVPIGSLPQQVGDIDVIPVTIGGKHGLRFVGPFFATTTQAGSTTFIQFGLYGIDFAVQTTDPNVLINGVSQSFPFTHFGEGAKGFRVFTDVDNCVSFFCDEPGEFDFLPLNSSLHGVPFMPPIAPSPGTLSEDVILPINSSFLASTVALTYKRGALLSLAIRPS
jgi:hypothetical protein